MVKQEDVRRSSVPSSTPNPNNCPPWAGKYPDNDPRVDAAILAADERSQLTMFPANADICEWHRLLFTDFVPLGYYAGNFRQVDTSRPCLAGDVGIAGYFGEHHKRVSASMAALEAGLRNQLAKLKAAWPNLPQKQRSLQLAQITASYVGRFIRIHPFMNGNGRASRLLVRWFLDAFKVPPIWEIDPRPPEPYAAVMHASMGGNDLPLAGLLAQHIGQCTNASPR